MRVVAARTSGKTMRLGMRLSEQQLLGAFAGTLIRALRRRGKYLLIDGSGDDTLLVHLGMSGRLRLYTPDEPEPPHTHVVLCLAKGRTLIELRYSDPRRFGFVEILGPGAEAEHRSLKILGPDALLDEIQPRYLFDKLKARTSAVKAVLLDQAVLAGIGNIYASEALWHAGIRPGVQARTISLPRAGALAIAVQRVLAHALEHGGTTLRDFVAADGRSGDFYGYLNVYGRDGEACPRGCGGMIRKTVLGGRSTFHCPLCQRR